MINTDVKSIAEHSSNHDLVYLAVPYSHVSSGIRELRFRTVSTVAGEVMKRGICVYSPITHNHPISKQCEMPTSWDFWEKFDRAFLERSSKLVVLMLDGWKESVGVSAEIKIANELGIPVEYMELTCHE